MIGIYKITNKINGKSYIGQSRQIEKRFTQHINNERTSIGKDIKKYGKDNFEFSIVEICEINELDIKEREYIEKYNTIYPNGYNKTNGGIVGCQNFARLSKATIKNIIKDLKDEKLTLQEIGDKYSIDISMVYYLNRGDYHTDLNENYPLRPVNDFSKKFHYCTDCGEEISKGATRCLRCAYKLQRKVIERPSKNTLENQIKSSTFVDIGKLYGVTDNAIRRWCKDYGLPYRRRDICK